MPGSITTDSRLVHCSNARNSIVFTEFGIVTSTSPVHSPNALLVMNVTFLPMESDKMFPHPNSALSPILVTLSPMTISSAYSLYGMDWLVSSPMMSRDALGNSLSGVYLTCVFPGRPTVKVWHFNVFNTIISIHLGCYLYVTISPLHLEPSACVLHRGRVPSTIALQVDGMFWNTFVPTLVGVSPLNTMLSRDEQFLNARFPKLFTYCGSSIVAKLVHP